MLGIGGFLGPILAFLALMALLYSIHYQYVEFQKSTRQLQESAIALNNQNELIQKQNFESTFFQMLKLYNEIIQSITFGKTDQVKGRDAIRKIFDTFLLNYFNTELKGWVNTETHKETEYDKFYNDYAHSLGHLFRILYNILKFVNNSEVIIEKGKSMKDIYMYKKFYIDILRAQLSKYELALLFHNVIYFKREGKGKMYSLVMQYNIFKHLDKTMMMVPTDYQKLDRIIQDYKDHLNSIASSSSNQIKVPSVQ